jgi:tetratricopeptide (TPR) repeat protein
MITQNSANKEQDRQSAEERFRMGTGEYTEGRLEQAAISLGNAECFFYLVGDFQRAADSRAMIADIESQVGLLEQSTSSYWCAIQLYRDTGRTGDEAQSLLALGHVERQLGHLDQAQEAYLLARSCTSRCVRYQRWVMSRLRSATLRCSGHTWSRLRSIIRRPSALSGRSLTRRRLML